MNVLNPWGAAPGPQPGDPMREKIIPMIRRALGTTDHRGMEITGWDFAMLLNPQTNGIVAGIAIAVIGVDVLGPNKELCQYDAFLTWNPDQNIVDALVDKMLGDLHRLREGQKQPAARPSGLLEARIGFSPDGRPM